jgi:hypothetical protein
MTLRSVTLMASGSRHAGGPNATRRGTRARIASRSEGRARRMRSEPMSKVATVHDSKRKRGKRRISRGHRSALLHLLDRYAEALAARDPARLPLSARVRFTENGQQLPVGEGLWATAGGAVHPRYAEFADPAAGQVGFFGVVEEHGTPCIVAARMKVARGVVTQLETLVVRSRGFLFNPAAMRNRSSIFRATPRRSAGARAGIPSPALTGTLTGSNRTTAGSFRSIRSACASRMASRPYSARTATSPRARRRRASICSL